MSENALLTAALSYAKRGWPVFPVGRDKLPIIKEWQNKASTDPAQVTAWWTAHPTANIGLLCGERAGVWVLDVDPDKGGTESLAELLREFGELPPTLTTKTGRGGRHFFLERPEGTPIRTTANKLGKGLDTRGDGGYVVLAPSLHSNGNRYEWMNDLPPAAAPAWLIGRLMRKEDLQPDGDTNTNEFPPADATVLQTARALLAAHGPAIQGKGGDNHTFEAACILRSDFALTFKEAWPLFCEWNRTCAPPWNATDLANKLKGGVSYSRGEFGEHRRNPLVVPWVVEDPQDIPEQPAQPNSFEDDPTDLGNAHLLVRYHGERLRFVNDWGKWLCWNGRCWAMDTDGAAMRAAHDVVKRLGEGADKAQTEADRVNDRLGKMSASAMERGTAISREEEAELEKLQRIAKRCEAIAASVRKRYLAAQSNTALNAMLKQAGSLPPCSISSVRLDTDPFLLSVSNGTLDLKTGQLRQHRREDLITKSLPVAYDPEASAPRWEAFVSQCMLGDVALASYLQRAVGYTLTGDVTEHVFFFLQGDGQNGKSTFTTTLQALLGPYSTQAAPDLLLKRYTRHDSDTSNLPGVRFLVHGEPGRGKTFDDAIIKQLTGGDNISGRFMGKERFEFRPSHKIWISSNPMPNIDGQDWGIWRRVHLVKFNLQLQPSEVDHELPAKLRAELPGILTWAVRGCMEWQRTRLNPPPSITEAVAAYRQAEDTFREFLNDEFEKSPGCFVARAILYSEYQEWCVRNGIRTPASAKVFTPEIRRVLGKESERMRKGVRGFLGLKKRGDENPERASLEDVSAAG